MRPEDIEIGNVYETKTGRLWEVVSASGNALLIARVDSPRPPFEVDVNEFASLVFRAVAVAGPATE
jgi:hypothetical protein